MSYIHLTGDTTKILAFGYVATAASLQGGGIPSGHTGVDGINAMPTAGYTMVVLDTNPIKILGELETLLEAESTADQASIYTCVVCYRSAIRSSGGIVVAKQVIDDYTFPGGLSALKTAMLAVFPA